MGNYESFDLLDVRVADRIATTSIVAPPTNVMSAELFAQLAGFAEAIGDDPDVSVVVLRSGDPDFFIAHFDVELILSMRHDKPARRRDELNGFDQMCERYRTMSKVTIAEIAGRVGGGGNELALACDMRFASTDAVFSQPEVPLGLIPGGGGTQRLPRLVGRGRAMEIVLGGDDIDAATAEAWGMVNRTLAPNELAGFVDVLARRIAACQPEVVALAKAAVDHAGDASLSDGLAEESYLFEQTLRIDESRRRMEKFVSIGGQTREGELRLQELVEDLNG